NVGEFHFRFGDFLGPGLVLTAAGLAASAALLWLFRGRLRMVVACLVAAIALMAWVYGSFLVGDLTAFDGQAVPRAAAARAAPLKAAGSAGLCLLVAVAIGMMPRPATLVLLVLNVGLGVS